MPAIERQCDNAGMPRRLVLRHWPDDPGLWERSAWEHPSRRVQTISLAHYVKRHGLDAGETWPDSVVVERSAASATTPHRKKPRGSGRQLELFGERAR